TMAGEAPAANRMLAMKLLDTTLVMHCTSGVRACNSRWARITASRSTSVACLLPPAISCSHSAIFCEVGHSIRADEAEASGELNGEMPVWRTLRRCCRGEFIRLAFEATGTCVDATRYEAKALAYVVAAAWF